MTTKDSDSEDTAVRAAQVLMTIANECAPYLHGDDLDSKLFDCYWE